MRRSTPFPLSRLTHTSVPGSLRRRELLGSVLGLAGAGSLLSLAGCGGADTTDSTYLRFVNATVDYSSADFWVDGSKAIAALANGGAISGFYSKDAGSTQLELHAAGSSTSRLTETRSMAKDLYTSVLAYGTLASSLKFKYLEESNGTTASGNTRLRLFQASPTLTALDLYVSNTSSLADLTPTLTVAAYGDLSAFVTLVSGTYRLRITASGDKSNVLFDYTAGANLYSQSTITLAVVPRATGSLPNLSALPEKSSASLLPNALAA